MTSAPNWGRIPLELRQRAQWCIAGQDKAPHALGPNGLYRASVTDPATWMVFEEAAAYAYANGLHVGYVLSESDPYACVDLDVCDAESQERKGKAVDPTKWTTQEDYERFYKIIQYVHSYTETSTYGKGIHIWVRGNIGQGCKRGDIELYSQERFIITTGNLIGGVPATIEDRQPIVEQMANDMRAAQQDAGARRFDLVELEEDDSDDEIFQRAATAGNAEKFNELCAGRWQQYGFPSQSEADLALMSIFTFYSASNEQCRRLFRCTALGKREKATKNDRYLDETLRIIRHRQARADKVDDNAEQSARNLIAQMNQRKSAAESTPLHVVQQVEPVASPPPAAAAMAANAPTHPTVAAAPAGLEWPPGLTGEVAKFIYQSAPRPVREVSIVAALGLMAGICGKAFSIPQSGLNLYIILVARSAVGKEAMHTGISAIIKNAMMRAPSITNFVDFSDFASGPALVKACAANQSFVNVAGEWGRKLQTIAKDDGRNAAMASLRTVMTNLYQKSGPQAIVGGIAYSNKEQNISSVSGVSYSMIGETTPSTFYDALTEGMMEDGFLSRFTIVEYEGDRPPLNTQQVTTPPQYLTDAIAQLVQHAQQINGQMGTCVSVDKDNEAAELLWSFEQECDKEINSTKDESWRQMWNRASLKVMRIAALLAVGDHWYCPIVRKHHVEWGMMLIRKDIALMTKRMDSGDVGTGDHARERKLMSVMAEYLTTAVPDSYGIPTKMQQTGIVPRKYLQTRASRSSAFIKHHMGANRALDDTLRSLVDSGYVMECDKNKMSEQYNFQGKCYRILSLPDTAAERKKS